MIDDHLEINLRRVFAGASVVVTGHTGFKGSWLAAWLQLLGANVTGISLDPVGPTTHYEAIKLGGYIRDLRIDIRQQDDISEAISRSNPDYLFHLAAQALVGEAYVNPIKTWNTNVLGTLHVLEGLKNLTKPCASVFITSDKCYENQEWVWGYKETDPLGGVDPYSASKAACEILIHSHIRSFMTSDGPQKIATARAGNVIGGGDWSFNRIVPDAIRACVSNKAIELRNPNSTRPWQHVLEPLGGYLKLAGALRDNPNLHGESFNFGPNAQNNHTVQQLVNALQIRWGVCAGVTILDASNQQMHEAGLLKLNCDKALSLLDWSPVLNFNESINLTCDWYKKYYEHPDMMLLFTRHQINEYMKTVSRGFLSL